MRGFVIEDIIVNLKEATNERFQILGENLHAYKCKNNLNKEVLIAINRKQKIKFHTEQPKQMEYRLNC